MESKRQQKFAGQIREELALIFQRELKSILPEGLVTITQVRVSSDLGMAKIYLSFFNNPNPNEALKMLQAHQADVRYKLGKRIKNQVKSIPELNFFVDDTQDYVSHMDELFAKIIPGI